MIEEGIVSLWVGVSASEEVLDQYLTVSYTDEGDPIASQFAIDFRLPRYDEDFREAAVSPQRTKSLSELLAGVSYEDQIVPRFERLAGESLQEAVNTFVLLYNFRYEGDPTQAESAFTRLDYVGAVSYR